jgi:Xaa-Pro dipeptidase
VETLQPALKNGRNVWNRINMPESEFAGRLSRIRREMKSSGIDLLLLYGRGFNEYADPCYVSNFIIRLPRSTLMVIPSDKPPVIFFEGFVRGLPSLLPTTSVKDLRAANDAAQDCAAYLKEQGLIPATVGLGRLEQLMPHVQFRHLAEVLSGCRLVDASNLVPMLRQIKSTYECDQVRRAGLVLNKAFAHAGAIVFNRLTERTLEGAIRREARFEEAEDFRMLIALADEPNWNLRPPEDRILEPGRAVIVYAAVEFERYWAEVTRTLVPGDGTFALLAAEKTAYYPRAREAVRPGRLCAEVYRDVMEGARQAGIETLPGLSLGNGIGLSLDEAPLIDEESNDRLEPGMCITLRLAVRDREVGSVMTGNTLIVGADQVESVT